MANNDYFSIAYKILSYLKYCYERGYFAAFYIQDI